MNSAAYQTFNYERDALVRRSSIRSSGILTGLGGPAVGVPLPDHTPERCATMWR
jgi:hypothetical protein